MPITTVHLAYVTDSTKPGGPNITLARDTAADLAVALEEIAADAIAAANALRGA